MSMFVEMINHVAAEGSTEPMVFGPFHVEGAPHRAMGDSIIVDSMENDHEITFVDYVLGLDGNPTEGATLDVWETASNGFYDVQDGDQTAMTMRGIFTTGSDGRYEIRGIRPVPYQIPGDGPAGDLLFENGRHNWRPGHMHFVVANPGHKTVITHLFDAASDYLDSEDAWEDAEAFGEP